MDRLSLARSEFAAAPAALEREWLVTNGLGGYASGTVAQANTRRYHGLLVAALAPPLGRTVLVAKADASVEYQGHRYELGCNEFADGTLAPRGYERLTSFHLDGTHPVWSWQLGGATLEQRLWMSHGRNATWLRYTLRNAAAPVRFTLVPLTTYRDYHSHAHGAAAPRLASASAQCRLTAYDGARVLQLTASRGRFVADPDTYWRFHHRVEAERGLDADEDLFRPGRFELELSPGESVDFVFDADARTDVGTGTGPAGGAAARSDDGAADGADTQPRTLGTAGDAALHSERRRQSRLLQGLEHAPAWIRQLTLAADQFLVARADAAGRLNGTTVIAGYPWFGDWGRDTMIALPGLALATARQDDAAAVLRTFAPFLSQGMLPNRFPDGGEAPEYNTVDATLWYVHAIAQYHDATQDDALLDALHPALLEIVDWHLRGTRYGIQVDPSDGLLYAGERGVQLTWMDAKIGDWVVTPRIGKPVEINALWHYALSRIAAWSRRRGDRTAARRCATAAERAARSFASRFWDAARGGLYDVIDGPDGEQTADGLRVDATIRPNQIFAVSLGTGLLESAQEAAIVALCAGELLTPVGLRSLSPRSGDYAARYDGGPAQRDARYHQGTVWSWLLGPYALAHLRVHGQPEAASALLEAIAPHLGEACLGQISEIFDADPPHAPRGCFAQAWSVAETLRAWHTIERARARAIGRTRARGAHTREST